MMRILVLVCLLAGNVFGDARYQLAYRVKANGLIQLVAGLAGLSKMSSEGEEVLLKGSRVMVKGLKSTIILDYGTGKMVLIDHTDKTFERLLITDMQKRIAADIPGPLVDGLKRLFPGGGGGMASEVMVERKGDRVVMKSVEQFRARYGLSYLLPAMESIVSLTPTVERAIDGVRQSGDLVEALRIQVGVGGKIVNALVEIVHYKEGPVGDKEFLPPADYVEVQ